jgi:hypothetical protein
VNQHRHLAVRVDCDELRHQMLVIEQVHQMAGPLKSLLLQAKARLLRSSSTSRNDYFFVGVPWGTTAACSVIVYGAPK